MWRLARADEDERIVELVEGLYREDPGPEPVPRESTRRTLAELRRTPARGSVVVLDLDGRVAGYALLISFWSNELGGETCDIDELYVVPEERGRGHASELFGRIARGDLGPAGAVGIALVTTPQNDRARKLYGRLGLSVVGSLMVRRFGR